MENEKPSREDVINALDYAWKVTQKNHLDDTLLGDVKTHPVSVRLCPNIEKIFPGPKFNLPAKIHNDLYNNFWNNLDIKPFPPLNIIVSEKGAAVKYRIHTNLKRINVKTQSKV